MVSIVLDNVRAVLYSPPPLSLSLLPPCKYALCLCLYDYNDCTVWYIQYLVSRSAPRWGVQEPHYSKIMAKNKSTVQ